jgi:hypothetical protein
MNTQKKFTPLPPLGFNIKSLWKKNVASPVREQFNNLNIEDKTDALSSPTCREKTEEKG